MINQFNKNFFRLYRKSAKFNLELSKDLREIIIGLMMGDLFAEKRNSNSNTRFKMLQLDRVSRLFVLLTVLSWFILIISFSDIINFFEINTIYLNLFSEISSITYYSAITPIALTKLQKQAVIGSLLGDGHLCIQKQNSKYTGNARLQFGYKEKAYASFILEIYNSLCTKNKQLKPWPNTGLPIISYHFATRAFPAFTDLHSMWYRFDPILNTFIKIVPSNISDLLTPRGFALWIMDDAFWNQNTIWLCSHSFTLVEVDLLIEALFSNFGLIASKNRRILNGKVCFMIRFSAKADNINNLRNLVQTYFIPSMLYKLGL